MAERISYLAETFGLLPSNHFGGRKRRSTEQALTILVEKIQCAWRSGKVLTAALFDIKGAFNGVNKSSLLHSLRERRVPEVAVRWVENFLTGRKAQMLVNSFSCPIADIHNAGLPQGSPLSPVLFLFFNADLVQQKIDANGGSLAFIDDYTTWVTGCSAEENTRKIQQDVIPKLDVWKARSGAILS